jgi:hypothetical protein
METPIPGETFIIAGSAGSPIFSTELLSAGAAHVRDYNFHTPRDRNVRFAMAITPGQDLLSWVAKGDGKWQLTRVTGWLEKEPVERTIVVPGWSRSELANILSVGVDLLVTPDGAFAICIASGIWGRGGRGFDDIVSIIDLREFRVVTTSHPPAQPDEGRAYYLDRSGRLVLRAFKRLSQPSDPVVGGNEVRLVLLDLPDLTARDQCHYSESRVVVPGRTGAILRRDGERNCDELLARTPGGPISLSDYLDGLQDAFGLPRKYSQKCLIEGTSHDGRFEIESCDDLHRNWWGTPVITMRNANIVSIKTSQQIGSVKETTHDSVESRFAYQNGRDYLLVLEGGTQLKVYEIKE